MSMILEQREKLGSVKFYLNSRVRMVRHVEGGDETIIPHFKSPHDDYVNDFLNKAFQQMQNVMEEFVHRGSNWRIDVVIGLAVKIVPYQPLKSCQELWFSS